MTLPDARNVDGDLYGFTNNTAYTSYKVVFTDNKGPDASANSIQFAEIQLFTIPEPASIGMLALGGLAMAGRRRNRK